MGPCARGSGRHDRWSNEGAVLAVFPLSRSRPGIDKYKYNIEVDVMKRDLETTKQ